MDETHQLHEMRALLRNLGSGFSEGLQGIRDQNQIYAERGRALLFRQALFVVRREDAAAFAKTLNEERLRPCSNRQPPSSRPRGCLFFAFRTYVLFNEGSAAF